MVMPIPRAPDTHEAALDWLATGPGDCLSVLPTAQEGGSRSHTVSARTGGSCGGVVAKEVT